MALVSKLGDLGKQKTLELLFLEIEADHFRVNNLFNLPDGSWQCNLATDGTGQEFAHGATAGEAVQEALIALRTSQRRPVAVSSVALPEAGAKTGREAAAMVRNFVARVALQNALMDWRARSVQRDAYLEGLADRVSTLKQDVEGAEAKWPV